MSKFADKSLQEAIDDISLGYITEVDFSDGQELQRAMEAFREEVRMEVDYDEQYIGDDVYLNQRITDLEDERDYLQGVLEENDLEWDYE